MKNGRSDGMDLFDKWLSDPEITPEQRAELMRERGAMHALKQLLDDPDTWERASELTIADMLGENR